jgi:Protein of unknown function (DUF1328)
MLKWAAILLVIALVAALFGFTGIASDWREVIFSSKASTAAARFFGATYICR